MEMEAWYSKRYEDKDLVDDVKDRYEALMQGADAVLQKYSGCAKSVRSAIVPCLVLFL